jgi:coproporphyrinogen III oxidase
MTLSLNYDRISLSNYTWYCAPDVAKGLIEQLGGEGLRMRSQRLTIITVFTFSIVLTQFLAGSVQASDNLEALKSEQAAFANRFSTFLERMDTMYFERVAQLNGNSRVETKAMSNEYADYEVKVARGPVVEKGGRSLNITKKPTRSFQKPNLWSRYFLFDVHPKTPLVGMLHAAIVIQFYPDDTATIAGFLDILQTANREEDLAFLKQAMDEVYEKYGIDPTSHRKLSNEGHDEDDPLSVDNSRRRKTAQVGGSFYGSPLFSVTEENFSFMLEAYETMVVAYLDVVERRKDTPYGEVELAAQDAMRKNWLEDRFFSDPYTTGVTPYEIWSLMSLPPTVKF